MCYHCDNVATRCSRLLGYLGVVPTGVLVLPVNAHPGLRTRSMVLNDLAGVSCRDMSVLGLLCMHPSSVRDSSSRTALSFSSARSSIHAACCLGSRRASWASAWSFLDAVLEISMKNRINPPFGQGVYGGLATKKVSINSRKVSKYSGQERRGARKVCKNSKRRIYKRFGRFVYRGQSRDNCGLRAWMRFTVVRWRSKYFPASVAVGPLPNLSRTSWYHAANSASNATVFWS
jgi:hypothetical protein